MLVRAPRRERRDALNQLTQLDLKPKETRRFIKDVVSGKIDPYVDYKLKKNRFGKYRSISSPFPELKSLQQQILREVYEVQCHPAAHGYVPERSVVTAASAHLEMQWGVKLDLEDFFHHVTGRRVESALTCKIGSAKAELYAALCTRVPTQTRRRLPTKFNRRHGIWAARQWRQWLAGLTTATFGPGLEEDNHDAAARMTTYTLLSRRRRIRRYLPQGSPTSGYLANLAFARVDHKIASYAEKLGFTYTRYSDDILISTRDVKFDRELAAKIIHEVQKTVSTAGFTLNRAKTRILTPGSRKSYLGLIVSGPMTRLPREVRERITAELRDIRKFGFETQYLRFEKGLSRIRRDPAKNGNTENSYWHVLRGFLCWVELADPKLYAFLEDTYRIQKEENPFLSGAGDDDPDGMLISALFDRNSPRDLGGIDLSSAIKIVDINLEF